MVMGFQSARQAASAYPGVVLLAQRGYRFGDAIQVVVDRSRRERRSQRRECGVHGDVQPRKEGGLFRHRHLPSRVVGGAVKVSSATEGSRPSSSVISSVVAEFVNGARATAFASATRASAPW